MDTWTWDVEHRYIRNIIDIQYRYKRILLSFFILLKGKSRSMTRRCAIFLYKKSPVASSVKIIEVNRIGKKIVEKKIWILRISAIQLKSQHRSEDWDWVMNMKYIIYISWSPPLWSCSKAIEIVRLQDHTPSLKLSWRC